MVSIAGGLRGKAVGESRPSGGGVSGEADGGVEQWRRTRLERRGRDGGGVGAALLAKVGGNASEEEGDGMGGGRRGKWWRCPELERRRQRRGRDGWRQRRRGGRRRRKRLVGYGMEEPSTEAYRESSPPGSLLLSCK